MSAQLLLCGRPLAIGSARSDPPSCGCAPGRRRPKCGYVQPQHMTAAAALVAIMCSSFCQLDHLLAQGRERAPVQPLCPEHHIHGVFGARGPILLLMCCASLTTGATRSRRPAARLVIRVAGAQPFRPPPRGPASIPPAHCSRRSGHTRGRPVAVRTRARPPRLRTMATPHPRHHPSTPAPTRRPGHLRPAGCVAHSPWPDRVSCLIHRGQVVGRSGHPGTTAVI
jgi:hypothetical protein